MKALTTRPLLCICMTYLAALACIFLLPGTRTVFLIGYGVALLSATAAFLIKPLKNRRFLWLGMSLAICFAVWRGGTYTEKLTMWKNAAGAETELSAVVEGVQYATDRGAEMTVQTETLNGIPCRMRITLTSDGPYYADPGERIRCRIRVLSEEETERTAEDRRYDTAKGIMGAAVLCEGDFITEDGGFSLHTWFSRLRESCRIRIYALLPERSESENAAGLICGLLLGDKNAVPTAVKRDFRRAGLSHMLAVSGMHLSVLLFGLDFLLLKLKVGKNLRLIPELFFVLLIMGVTGFSPSVCRAGIMWGMLLLAQYAQAERDGYTALFLSAAVICSVSPYAVLDIGLILSVSATFGILFLAEPTEARLRRFLLKRRAFRLLLRILVFPLITTLSAMIFVLPVSLFIFGEFSLIAPIANLLIGFPVEGLLLLSPIMLLISFIPGLRVLTPIPAALIRVIAAAVLWIVRRLSDIRGVLIGVRYPFLMPVILVSVILAVVLFRKHRSRTVLYAAYFAGIVLFAFCLRIRDAIYADSVFVSYHVRNTNESVCMTAGDTAMLIDCSDGAFNQTYESWEALENSGITELDTVMLTHYHVKHRYLLYRLSQTAVVRRVLLPEPETEEETEIYETLTTDPSLREIRMETYRRGTDAVCVGGAAVTVFPPAYLKRSVQPLLGFSAVIGDTCLTYLSSAGWEYENEASVTDYADYREAALEKTDILLCGVHGPNVKNAYGMRENGIPYVCAAVGNASYLPLFEGKTEIPIPAEQSAFAVFRLMPDGFENKN